MLVSQSIPNLIGGVSQQPPPLTLPNQAAVCENAFPSMIEGLTKRPQSQFVRSLNTGQAWDDDCYVHFINRDGTEKYVVMFDLDGTIKVFDPSQTSGNYFLVYGDASDQSYLTGGPGGTVPRRDLKMVTIADTTYVVNIKKTVALTGATFTQTPAPTNIAVFKVNTAQNAAVYTINIDGVVAAVYTAAASPTIVKTDDIAAGLVTALNAAGFTSGNGWTKGSNGGYLYITKTNGAAFRIEALDSINGSALTLTQNTVAKFTDLPSFAYQGMVVKVAGDFSGNKATAYYVQFTQTSYSGGGPNLFPGPGVWQECANPGVTTTLDPLTMPRTLRRLQDDVSGTVTGTPNSIYFKFDRPTWGTRTAGDDTFNPVPSFVGKTINDVFLYRNRLGFLSDTNVCLSESGSFQNFWRRTILTTLATDPIDVSAAHPRVIKLRSAVQWNQELIVFGDLVQFVLTSDGDVLSPATVKMVAATEFDNDPECRPAIVSNVMCFPFRTNGYSGLREYFIETYTSRKMARGITEHVPKYIPGNVIQIAHSPSADLFLCRSSSDRSSLYLYKWWNDTSENNPSKVQSSWSRWNFDQPGVTTKIMGIQFWGQSLYVAIKRSTASLTVYDLELINVDAVQGADSTRDGTTDNFAIHLDRLVPDVFPTTSSYDAGTDTTTYTLPWFITCPANMVVITRFTNIPAVRAGTNIPIVSAELNGSQVVVRGNMGLTPVWIGERYTMRYRFQTFTMRDPQGASKQGGRLQLRSLSVRYSNTANFRIDITAENRPVFSQTYGGLTLGDTNAAPGAPPLTTNKARVMLGAKNDRVTVELVNDSPLPTKFIDAEWEGENFERARRM
jgi:hypothetical protein